MINANYRAIKAGTWQGRVDSDSDYDAFRWHQWIEPIDLSKNDILPFEGELGIAFIGFCCDEGVGRNRGRTGAANGPQAIRKEMANLPCRFDPAVKLFDAGDILCESCTLEESQNALAAAVEKLLGLNLFPIVLGGGHEVAFGHYKGILENLMKQEEKPTIGIINFDAHFDLRPYPNGGSSGTMFRQIADLCEEKELKYAYLCLGIQKHSNTIELFKTADRLGAKYILAKDIIDSDDWNVLEKLDDFVKKNQHIYITICSDVFSSAFAPGVSATQPLGLDPERVLKFLKYLLRTNKVISFDIAEVSPRFDQDNTTANLAAVLIFSIVNTLSQIHNLSLD
ncbi:formimidoylglutamase [Geosporobacter ferrireducens]|uniref:formimidoylglutamase n=1 Tax=Geosporobacter ferrireducens TaxID=1424294 RepID=UPI00139F081B|nr:formimidoylglutamase [Geosporobacter ferrireducens]MTI57553.1 formimidoylglutamase [Geosporobacter ferrireducens]